MHGLMERAPAQSLAAPFEAPADDGQALYVQGLLALRGNRAEDAVALLTQALRRQPVHQGMRRNLVRALLVLERYEQVVLQANTALSHDPDDAELHFARGTALGELGQSSLACAAFSRALTLQPNHAPSWLNLGNASADQDDLQSAETLYRTAIRLDAALPEAHTSLGYVLTMQGRLPEAIATCEAAIRLRPKSAQAHWNLAVAALLAEDLPRGWQEFEWRKQHPRFQADFPDLPGPRWDGGDVAGRIILVRAEQGFGDVIQFARYLTMIRDRGGLPVLMCAPSLVGLIQSMPGVAAFARGEPLPRYDAWVDLLSLPLLFGTTLDSIPASDGYLAADPLRVQDWHERLPAGRKAGIVFAGNPQHSADRRRSVPLNLIDRLPNISGLSFVNLQHGPSAGGLPFLDLTRWMSDYAGTAALVANLDVVITVDTSVAHLAGALGKPVWIMLPHAPDWRWFLGRADSPWYRSARLFRQAAPGDWDSVLSRVIRELALGF